MLKFHRFQVNQEQLMLPELSQLQIPFFSCSAPIYGVPRTPTASIPTPDIALSVKAPPFGVCSDTTPSMVGQKNVLPSAYRVAATKIIVAPEAPEKPLSQRLLKRSLL